MRIRFIALLLVIILLLGLLCSCNQTGPQGPKGDAGSQGEPGPAGKDGASFLTGKGAPSNDLGKVGDSYLDISLGDWGFYVKGEDGWKLMGYIEAEPAPLTLSDLNGSYVLSHVVSGSSTYKVGDVYAGMTLSGDMIQVELDEGVGHLAVNFGSLKATNITCTIEYDKLIMICEDAINITGEPLSAYELTIVQDGEIYVVLEAYGDYYYVKKSDQDGDQGGNEGDTNIITDEIILLVDTSYSADGAKEQVDNLVKSIINSGTGTKIGIVTFGYDQVYAVELSQDTSDMYSRYLQAPSPDTSATDIESALNYAASLFTSGSRSKIVLISDGRETDGDSICAAKSAASKGITIDTICIAEDIEKNEAQIVSLGVPDNIVVGESFTLTATIQSSFSGWATINLYDNGVAGTQQVIELTGGSQTVNIPCAFALPGLHDLTIELVSADDTIVQNNTYTSCIYIRSFDKILVIESIENESESLREILDEDLNVSVVNASDPVMMPKTVDELRAYDQVILCNISYSDMPVGFDELLYSYVYNFGGGLFTICGNEEDLNPNDDMWTTNAYTREDMFGTVYQELLPVEIIDYTPPVGVMIIIDTSASMLDMMGENINKLYAAKQSAVACLDAITDLNYVGIMSLSGTDTMELELTHASQRDKIICAIENIGTGEGATVFSTALESAGEALKALTSVEKRHIILITDGQPVDTMEQYGRYMMENARAGITMSMIGIGCPSEDASIMKNALLMYAGEPNFFNITNVSDISIIPMLIREDLMIPEIKASTQMTFTPTFGTTHIITSGINEAHMPTLDGFYGAKAKEGAEVIIKGPYNVPIYTQWKCGLGTVGTFACDLNGTWSQDFIYSDTGRQLINNIVSNLFPTHDIHPDSLDVIIKGDNYSRETTIATDLEEGQYIEMTVRGLADENGAENIQRFISDALSDRIAFSFNVTKVGIHEIKVQKKYESGLLLEEYVYYLPLSYSKEYDAFFDRESAAENLTKIAKLGNGRVIHSPEDVFIFTHP